MIEEGVVTVNGVKVRTPALNVVAGDVVKVNVSRCFWIRTGDGFHTFRASFVFVRFSSWRGPGRQCKAGLMGVNTR